MQECYLPTGNEWVSLPTLQACTGALESFSFLHMGHKGLIEQRGGASLPLMTPFFETEGERASLQSLTWGTEIRLDSDLLRHGRLPSGGGNASGSGGGTWFSLSADSTLHIG